MAVGGFIYSSGVIVLYGVSLAEKRAARAKRDASQPHTTHATPARLVAPARGHELSPPRAAPVESFTAQRVETAEMVRPPSVTENTARLLDEEADARRR